MDIDNELSSEESFCLVTNFKANKSPQLEQLTDQGVAK